MRGKFAEIALEWVVVAHFALISRLRRQLPPRGKPRLSKKVCSPLGPLCEGAPPAGGGGENCAVARNILGYGKVLSLRPFGAPPSQREVFRHAEQPTKMGCPGYFCLMGNSTFNVNWFSWVVISAVPPYFSAVS